MTNQNDHTKQIELTKEGLTELKQELAELKEKKLPTVIKRVSEAREYGDLSENSEYHDAKDEQNLIETRIDEIEGIVSKATVVKNTRSTTIIGVGTRVVIQKKGAKKTREFTIVGEYEADPSEGKISKASPIGAALIGKKKSETATVKAPAGTVEYTIVEIK